MRHSKLQKHLAWEDAPLGWAAGHVLRQQHTDAMLEPRRRHGAGVVLTRLDDMAELVLRELAAPHGFGVFSMQRERDQLVIAW